MYEPTIDPSLLVGRDKTAGLHPEPLAVLSPPQVKLGIVDLKITNYQCIGSYNWLEPTSGTPTILIPGSPPKWLNRSIPHQIPQCDLGVRIIDQSGYQTTKGRISALLPLVASVVHYRKRQNQTPYDWTSVDIVTGRAALRKLNRWASNKAPTRDSDNNFRLDFELLGKNTLVLSRTPSNIAETHLLGTYRTGFQKAFTAPSAGCEKALEHYRIVSYDMNDLKMVVQFEVDAYVPETSLDMQIEELTARLRGSSFDSQMTSHMHGLTIQEGGKEIPTPAIVEMNTRSQRNRRPIDWSEVYTQMFLSQTGKYIVPIHDKGLFFELQEHTLEGSVELAVAKEEAEMNMKSLRYVLDWIRKLVITRGKESKYSLVCDAGLLKLYERENTEESCLPKDILRLFDSA